MTTPEQNYRPLYLDEVIQEGDQCKHLASTVWGLCIASIGKTPKEWPEFVFRRPIPAEPIPDRNECPSESCPYCSGEKCARHSYPDKCDCDVLNRHPSRNIPAEPEPKGEEATIRKALTVPDFNEIIANGRPHGSDRLGNECECDSCQRWDQFKRMERAGDYLDLMVDEFKRIIALTDNSEILGICGRATSGIKQLVPLIEQRDNAERDRNELRAQLAESEKEVKRLKDACSIDQAKAALEGGK